MEFSQRIKQLLNENIQNVCAKLEIDYEILGDNIYAKCPIHEGSDNPRAFSYSIDKSIWKCWTRDCQQDYRNDVFGLIRGSLERQTGMNINFNDVLKWSCNILNIKQQYNNSTANLPELVSEEFKDFYDLVSLFSRIDTVNKPHESIELDCNVQYPSAYFTSRGFKQSTMTHFQVGDCLTRSSKMYDRAIIPIHNDDGSDIIATICRSTKIYKIPKFLFFSKDGFDKRYFFYNYHRAIDRAKLTGCLFLVEGQGDVWKLYESGVFNAMSIFGKTISKEQEYKLLKMPITHIIILTDNDQAGRESKTQIQRQLGRAYKLTFPRIQSKDIGDMTIDQIHSQLLPQVKGAY